MMQLFENFMKRGGGKMSLAKKSSRRVYLDHAGSTPLSERAKKVLIEALSLYGNPSAIYQEGVDARTALLTARKSIAEIVSCRPHELYFTGTGTESVALATAGVLRAFEEKNEKKIIPHMIVTSVEHPAVRELTRELEKAGRISLTLLPVEHDGLIKAVHVKEALRPETILISIMYVNNELGTIMPIKEIGRMLALYKEEMKSEYPYFHTDACQATQYLPLDVNSLRVDLMTMNSSKIYGPKGIALLYKKEKCLLSPVVLGGGQERGLRSGTEATPLILSFAEALRETREVLEQETKKMEELASLTKNELTRRLPQLIWYGSFEKGKRVPCNINFSVPGISSEEMILRLDAKGFAVSHKSACASEDESGSYVITALGKSEVEAKENIRVTMGRETTKEDMERFVEVVKEISEKYKANASLFVTRN
jgi:cysteine desulfurase